MGNPLPAGQCSSVCTFAGPRIAKDDDLHAADQKPPVHENDTKLSGKCQLAFAHYAWAPPSLESSLPKPANDRQDASDHSRSPSAAGLKHQMRLRKAADSIFQSTSGHRNPSRGALVTARLSNFEVGRQIQVRPKVKPCDLLHIPQLNNNSGAAKFRDPSPVVPRVRVNHGDNDLVNPTCNDRLGARWRSSVERTGLESYKENSLRKIAVDSCHCANLGMSTSWGLRMPPPNNLT